MVGYLFQLIIYRFVQIILFKYLFDTGNKLFVIVVDDKRTMLQLIQIGVAIIVQISVFIVLMRKIYFKMYLKWIVNLRQKLNPIYGLSILIIPIGLYFYYMSTHSGQYNGIKFNGFLLNLVFFLAGALSEEFIFRGYFYKLMIKKNRKFALYLILLQAFLFTFTHVNNPGGNLVRVMDIFFAGVILGVIAIQGFIYAVAFHFLWNFFQAYGLGINVSGYAFSESMNTLFDAMPWESSILAGIILGIGALISLGFFITKKQKFI